MVTKVIRVKMVIKVIRVLLGLMVILAVHKETRGILVAVV